MADNPYAAPRTHVEDAPTSLPDGDFIPEGRGVPAGNGWRWIADAWAFTGEQRWTSVRHFHLAHTDHYIAANFVPIIGALAVSLFSPVLLGGFLLGCDAMRRGEPTRGRPSVRGFSAACGPAPGSGCALACDSASCCDRHGLDPRHSPSSPVLDGAQPFPRNSRACGDDTAGPAGDPGPEYPDVDGDVVRAAANRVERLGLGAALKTSFVACLKNILSFLVWSLAILVFGFSRRSLCSSAGCCSVP